MIKVITAPNFQELVKIANDKGIEKNDIITLVDRVGQVILVYE